MSSELPRQPEFFPERSLGKLTAERLRAAGWIVHTIHDHFPKEGEETPDQERIEFGRERDWICLTKDKKIRYRAPEIGALRRGHIFCLAGGNLKVDDAVERLTAALPAIHRALRRHEVGFWHVHQGGKVRRMWPSRD